LADPPQVDFINENERDRDSELHGADSVESRAWAYENLNLHLTIEDMIAEGDRVVVRHTFSGTHQGDFMGLAPTGKYVTTTAIVISRISNGKGIETWINGDDLGRMQQLGVIPAMG
jgi:predicted ester cyclase